MTPYSVIGMMLAVEAVALIWAAAQPDERMLGAVGIACNMILITTYGSFLMQILGYTTNVGCIWHASVVCAFCIILEKYGPREALAAIPRVYAMLMLMIMTGIVLALFPVLSNNATATPILIVADHSLRIVAGSFSAFFLSIVMALIPVWTAVRRRAGPCTAAFLASVMCQAVDSPAFFIPAFWGELPMHVLIEAMLVGFLFKSALAVALMPVFVLALRLRRVP